MIGIIISIIISLIIIGDSFRYRNRLIKWTIGVLFSVGLTLIFVAVGDTLIQQDIYEISHAKDKEVREEVTERLGSRSIVCNTALIFLGESRKLRDDARH